MRRRVINTEFTIYTFSVRDETENIGSLRNGQKKYEFWGHIFSKG